MAPSSCNYYNISEENMQVILDGTGNITEIQVVKENIFFLNWIFRRIPSWPAAASGVTMTPSSKTLLSPRTIGFVALLTMWPTCTRLESLGLSWEPSCSGAFPYLSHFLLATQSSFSAIADFYGRKTSFYIGIVTVMLFSFLQIPVYYSYDLFALFKVTTLVSDWSWTHF